MVCWEEKWQAHKQPWTLRLACHQHLRNSAILTEMAALKEEGLVYSLLTGVRLLVHEGELKASIKGSFVTQNRSIFPGL